jgi:hypothetical protein
VSKVSPKPVLAATDARTVELAGDGPIGQDSGAVSHFTWSTTHEAGLYVGKNLVAPPVGSTYQLWLIVDDQPVSVGTFEPDTSGVAELLVTVNPSRVAVTQEPDGGSDQPTTPVLISASLV